MNRLHLPIAEILFYGGTAHRYTGHYPNGQGLANVDRALLVKAVKSLLANPNGRARSMVAGVYPKLTQTELDQLWADIYRATKHQAPSGVMFSFEARASGLALLAEHGYAEGIDLAMAALRQEGWGHHKRDPAALKTLLAYGQAIQKHLPEIKTIIDDKIQFLEGKRGDRSKEVQELQMLWQQLQQTAQTPRRLKTLAGHFHRSEGDHE